MEILLGLLHGGRLHCRIIGYMEREENNGNLVQRSGMSIRLRPKCLDFLANTLLWCNSDPSFLWW